LSFEGSKGELGGQSRVAGTSAIVWYRALLKTTSEPVGYAEEWEGVY
jgi:hypothetical protein